MPIIVFYCDELPRAAHRSARSSIRVVELFDEHSRHLVRTTAAELLRPGPTCAKCGGAEFRKENDILDVWFDSGSSHLAVLDQKNGPALARRLYLEGGDQYRGWFHCSLLIGVGLRGGAPYRECADARLDARRRRPRDVASRSAT